ncbi:MAG: tetratricopeptide repeat protein, partial [Anaerolineales bacterium]|nr:tetratricopeptide repeat protein [Anaerolineales bacterium]
MTSILLHDYVEQVEKLIDADRLVEAIEHCRHILSHYPRHIDTYRALGKALLEKQDYSAASDLFLRILGAEPNDFISHVGLSIIYKDQSQYDQALWHLERAHEIQPYNIAIQGELRELYAATTDSRPGIIPLTPGALARLYVQGELYQQAILELRRILADEPERFDLQVLLAEALWRDDQRIDA